MLKAYKFRLYPNKEQKISIMKHINCCRYVYNFSLEQKIRAYELDINMTQYDLNKLLPKLKKKNEWLKEMNSQSLQQENAHLDSAFKRFFREKKGFPKFKSKKSFSVPQNYEVDFTTNKIKLPKIGLIKAKLHRKFKGKMKTATVSVTPTGKYFISILVDDNKKLPKPKKFDKNNTLGIDVGIEHFATLSNGEKIDNPKYLKSKLDRIKILQKRASKKQKNSKNRIKANLRVAKLYKKINNQRRDFLHKLTTKIVSDSENQAIAIENLNIQGMSKNHHLARSITDTSWYEFFSQLEYKCKWKGKTLLKVGRFEPTSKICSVCGTVNNELDLSIREWTCANCKTKHDRDVNAAINIKKFASQHQNLISEAPKELRGVPVEMSALAESAKQEVAHFNGR